MAAAFQKMLERFGLTDKIHAVNADNASANNKLTAKLAALDNSFEKDNHVRCFNHTMQLSAKTLLAPFNTAISQKATQDDEMPEEEDDQPTPDEDEDDEDDEDDEEDDAQRADDEDDGIDELGELSESERAGILESTAAVRETVTKVSYFMLLRSRKCSPSEYITDCWLSKQVRQLAFAIIHSTTIALPAWRRTCAELGLRKRLIPRDVVTRWNSTYDMMRFVLTYRTAIDQITADKVLKLRRYELDNDDWVVIEDLVSVLEVNLSFVHRVCYATFITDTFFYL
jgi:hypothetical protein